MNHTKMRVPMGDGLYFAADNCFEPEYKEVYVWIEDEKESVLQDIICIQRPRNEDSGRLKDCIDIKIWTDGDSDEWTREISDIGFGEYTKEAVEKTRKVKWD